MLAALTISLVPSGRRAGGGTMAAIGLLGFVFGIFGLIAFGQLQGLKREVADLRRLIDDELADDG